MRGRCPLVVPSAPGAARTASTSDQTPREMRDLRDDRDRTAPPQGPVTAMTTTNGATSSGPWREPAFAVQCGYTALVALGAAYASYRHGRDFALHFGADHTTATIWPLIVDGLLMIATVELWKPTDTDRTRSRWTVWLAFTFGISLSLCANIGSTPDLSILGITVAACPPLALLLTVELLNRALKRHRTDATPHEQQIDDELGALLPNDTTELQPDPAGKQKPPVEQTAEERMRAPTTLPSKPTAALPAVPISTGSPVLTTTAVASSESGVKKELFPTIQENLSRAVPMPCLQHPERRSPRSHDLPYRGQSSRRLERSFATATTRRLAVRPNDS